MITVYILATFFVLMVLVGLIQYAVARYDPRNKGPRRLRVSAVVFGLLVLAAAEASACNRCGIFGRGCRYYSASTYVAPVVAAAPASQNVYVIQNSYPAPLVGQGTSAVVSNGGYQSLTLPLFDPTAYFSQSLQLIKAANDTNALQHERTSALVQRVAELQAPTVERIAAGQAASQVLKAAGLDPAHNASGQASAVVISRNSDGQVQVLPLESGEAAKITARLSTTTTITGVMSSPAPPQAAAGDYPLFAKFCASCHGTQLAAPKGGIFLGDDLNVATTMHNRWRNIEKEINSGRMPKGGPPLTDDEKRGVALELDAMIRRGLGETD